MARKPQGNHGAYEEQAPSIIITTKYKQKYTCKVNARVTVNIRTYQINQGQAKKRKAKGKNYNKMKINQTKERCASAKVTVLLV